jgi:hypothetical protein
MIKFTRSKPVVILFIFAFILFWMPELIRAQEIERGNLIGFVYGPDNTSPIEGAVLKIRNLTTGSLYESMASDDQGRVEFENVDEGLYLVGISTSQGDFNIENLVGIKPNKTANIAFALRPLEQEGQALRTNERCTKGDWYVPAVLGQCDENYKWNPDSQRCACMKKSPLAFFLTPLGAGIVMAASAGVVAFSLNTDGERSSSAFK